MSPAIEKKLTELYDTYNNSVKLLVADIEARTQHFPIEILNEVRAFTDHIARCYLSEKTEAQHLEELKKAEGHIKRITLDCYKYLNIYLFDEVAYFEKRDMRHVDLSFIDNGKFYLKFKKLRREAVNLSREARKTESKDKPLSLQLYEKTYNKYNEIEQFIDDNSDKLAWAKKKFFKNNSVAILLWVIPIIVSSVITWVVATKHEKTKEESKMEMIIHPEDSLLLEQE
ncbi:MAG: hypothetical protein LBM20_06790 [Rikenellaceae bacterium]|jgi:hypothetical protein|nr:hypothetical protein [Rikenellaceae bacterium]